MSSSSFESPNFQLHGARNTVGMATTQSRHTHLKLRLLSIFPKATFLSNSYVFPKKLAISQKMPYFINFPQNLLILVYKIITKNLGTNCIESCVLYDLKWKYRKNFERLHGYFYWFWQKFLRLRLFHSLRLFDSLEYEYTKIIIFHSKT